MLGPGQARQQQAWQSGSVRYVCGTGSNGGEDNFVTKGGWSGATTCGCLPDKLEGGSVVDKIVMNCSLTSSRAAKEGGVRSGDCAGHCGVAMRLIFFSLLPVSS